MKGSPARGGAAYATGLRAETLACDALARDGWTILGRRLRTARGEIDIAAERDGLLSLVEVKARRTLTDAAHALLPRQRARLLAAAEILLGQNPGWGRNGTRIDVILVDANGTIRRISDAVRLDDE